MLIVRWLAVWDSRDGVKTDLQIFPAAKHIAAPYPVHCRLVVVGEQGRQVKPVTLEGAKVNQPINICLNDIFPEVSTVCGVTVELLPTRRSLDLTFSRCHLERRSAERFVRYVPWALPVLSKPARHNPGELRGTVERNALPVEANQSKSYSLLSINSQEEAAAVKIGLSGANTDSSVEILERDQHGTRNVFSVPSKGCVELPLKQKDSRILISLETPRNDDVALYFIERDVSNGAISSISAF